MGINKREFEIVDSGFPHKVGEFVLIAFAISVDELEVVIRNCLESNFIELHFNFGLRQTKSG